MKRFYKDVTVAPRDGGYAVLLDGRAIRTQGGGKPQIVPSEALAQALAQEWADQGETIDPTRFVVHRRLLIGKAFFVYFPAPYGLSPDGARFVPDFGNLRFIR